MKIPFLNCALVVALAFGLAASADDKASRVVKLPVTGVLAGCCDTAVEDAIRPIPGVASIAWESKGDAKWAILTLKKDAVLELSKVKEALAAATKDMGASMGTEYKLNEKVLPVDASVVFRTAAIPAEDKARLDKALAELKGFDSAAVETRKDGLADLTLKFKDKESAMLEQVVKILKDAKVELKDVIFLGAK
ncbi:MAG: hypothetical protein K8T20_16395 [Planctomycetes bacterium]|nr:hypothetical protein [Planctomycetota bacterium]